MQKSFSRILSSLAVCALVISLSAPVMASEPNEGISPMNILPPIVECPPY